MIEEKQLECWAEEMLFAIKEAGVANELALFRAIKSEVKRIIAEAQFLAQQRERPQLRLPRRARQQ